MNWIEISQMNPIEFIAFCLLWVCQILAWIIPAAIAVYFLMGFLGWLVWTIKTNGLPETILSAFGIASIVLAIGVLFIAIFGGPAAPW